MKLFIKRSLLGLAPVLDGLAAVPVLASALLFKAIRRFGLARLKLSRSILFALGVMPVTDHYYDPLPVRSDLERLRGHERRLPGFDLDLQGQRDLLKSFDFNEELVGIPRSGKAGTGFYYDNEAFCSGDAEFLYNVIRHFKPRRIIEVGSGFSTLMALRALEANRTQDPTLDGELVCVEPYEHHWLESLGIEVRRVPVQTLDPGFFSTLERDDILFIDSSHIIRPGGDVLFLYLQVLPVLSPGVLVHIHDVYTPADYPESLILEEVRFWNEQYLMEAFLSLNDRYEVVAALNHLFHTCPGELMAVCPVLKEQAGQREPGSFWIRRAG